MKQIISIILLFLSVHSYAQEYLLSKSGKMVIGETGKFVKFDGTDFVMDSISSDDIKWPLLAPNGSGTAPSYSFANYPGSGLYRSVSFGEPRLNLIGGIGTGVVRGGTLFGVAGSSETAAAGRINYTGGFSSGNSGGDVLFSGGATTSTNSAHKGGRVLFNTGSSTAGSSGDIIFTIGGGVTKGFVTFTSSYTPTSSADTNGGQGAFAWDDDYIYIRTTTGWKRSALTTF